jgi:hypothetical protein
MFSMNSFAIVPPPMIPTRMGAFYRMQERDS